MGQFIETLLRESLISETIALNRLRGVFTFVELSSGRINKITLGPYNTVYRAFANEVMM